MIAQPSPLPAGPLSSTQDVQGFLGRQSCSWHRMLLPSRTGAVPRPGALSGAGRTVAVPRPCLGVLQGPFGQIFGPTQSKSPSFRCLLANKTQQTVCYKPGLPQSKHKLVMQDKAFCILLCVCLNSILLLRPS